MRIDWVNHASFVLSYQGIKLLTDPWIDGVAFDESWALLSPTKFTYENFDAITHLWFSHEHPDHFNITTLKKIPPAIRKNIQVLYQKTKDKRVVNFCHQLGFKNILELDEKEGCFIGSGPEFWCCPHQNGDSWSYFKTENLTILNFNDCLIKSEDELRSIRSKLGKIDLLLTQFSYASWSGNRQDFVSRRRAAEGVLKRMELQINLLKPKYVMPFASFIWFCHTENYYMNDEFNTIHKAYDLVRDRTEATPIVLYPGDFWDIGDASYDSSPALEKYKADYQSIKKSEKLAQPKKVPIETLLESASEFIRKIQNQNKTILIYFLKSTNIYLDDYAQSYRLSIFGGLKKSNIARSACDIVLSSSALLFAFRFSFGGETLLISGRYEAPVDGDFNRFYKFFYIALTNGQGHSYPGFFRTSRQWVGRKLKKA